jgi:hypothetical protein
VNEKGAKRFFQWIQTGKPLFSLHRLLSEYSLELYMAWMLLIESIDMTSFIDPNSRFAFTSEPSPTPASATRHWYKTACEAPSVNYAERPAIPARLPGYFSVRGDWGLALAEGSRSYRLGTRALDFLSSRRANIGRLQQGIGLPTRDIGHPDGLDEFRTRLSYINRNRRRATVGYASMIGLGADETIRAFRNQCSTDEDRKRVFQRMEQPRPSSWDEMGNGEFYWLRRSRIEHYARNSKIWQKWLLRVMIAMQGIMRDGSPTWQNGFRVYDEIAVSTSKGAPDGSGNLSFDVPSNIAKLKTYDRFNKLVAFLKLELEWHTRLSGNRLNSR